MTSRSRASDTPGASLGVAVVVVVVVVAGQMVPLLHPYPRDIQEPGLYECVRIHGQYSRHQSSTLPHLAVSLSLSLRMLILTHHGQHRTTSSVYHVTSSSLSCVVIPQWRSQDLEAGWAQRVSGDGSPPVGSRGRAPDGGFLGGGDAHGPAGLGWGSRDPMARLVLLEASTADSQQTRACREHASLCGSPECSTEVPLVRREIHMPDIDETTVCVDGPAAC